MQKRVKIKQNNCSQSSRQKKVQRIVDPYTQNGPVIRLQRPSIKELNPAPLQVALLQVMKQRGKNVHVHWFMPKSPYPAYPVVGNLLKQKRKTWFKNKKNQLGN